MNLDTTLTIGEFNNDIITSAIIHFGRIKFTGHFEKYGLSLWMVKGKLHKDDNYPSLLYKNINGEVLISYWYRDGVPHRDESEGPAIIDNVNRIYQWYNNGILHRLNGPAVISHNIRLRFFNGREITREEHANILRSIMTLRRFKAKIRAFPLKNWYRLYLLTKTEAFVRWYYSPENGGGKIAKRKIHSMLINFNRS